MEKLSCLTSVVVPIWQIVDRLEECIQELDAILKEHYHEYEMVLIDCSPHGSDADRIVTGLLTKISCIRYIGLSEAKALEVQYGAGMENAIGDVIVLLDPRFDAPEIIPDVVKTALSGYDILVGTTSRGQGFVYNTLSAGFRRIIGQLINYDVPKNATNFRVLSRRAVLEVLHKGPFAHRLFINISSSGYEKAIYEYKPGRKQPCKRLLQGFSEAASVLVFSSVWPLRAVSGLGLAGSLLGLAISAGALMLKLFTTGIVSPGWTSLSMFVSLQFSILFVALFVYGEYLARLIDSREDEEYSVRFEKHSSVMLPAERLNVCYQSTESDLSPIQAGRDR